MHDKLWESEKESGFQEAFAEDQQSTTAMIEINNQQL